jgi:carbon-monoxide dehydrogenase large subunit
LTGSFLDYPLPMAARLPTITTVHLESPSPLNPLGIKGVGEGGAIAPAAALANALEDALAPFDIRVTQTPMTAPRIFQLLHGESRRKPAI